MSGSGTNVEVAVGKQDNKKSSKLNPMDFVTKEKREDADREWYSVDPDKMYPAVIGHLVTEGKLKKEEAELALTTHEKILGAPKGARETRTKVLETARLWFTKELHKALGEKPMGVHILKKEGTWRL